jgi:hypothetical protein
MLQSVFSAIFLDQDRNLQLLDLSYCTHQKNDVILQGAAMRFDLVSKVEESKDLIYFIAFFGHWVWE